MLRSILFLSAFASASAFRTAVPMSRAGSTARSMSRSARMGLPTYAAEGTPDTEDFKVVYSDGDSSVSPWHDVPLEAGDGLYNFVCEIPKMTTAKMEVDTKAENNPIVQDEKKGKLRYYHGPIFWNYGCLPQTWEDPGVKGNDEVDGCFGDNDPLDVVEIGTASREMGSIVPVKPLGVLAMIDDGELDWKLIAIAADDPMADKLNDVEDIDANFPGTTSGIREWFRWYKTPDDKPVNAFGYGERVLSKAEAIEVIGETSKHYQDLLSGKTEKGKLWIPEAVAA